METVTAKSTNVQYKSRSLAAETWRRLRKNKGAVAGMVFIVILVIATIVSGFIYDYETDIIGQNISERFTPPGLKYPFGTDQVGRNIFTRIIYGARYSLTISVGAVAIGLVVGVLFGSIAGFYGGLVDDLIMRVNDVLYAIPNIMIAVVVVSLFGTSTFNLLLALSINAATSFARIARASVMTLRGEEYIEASYAIGLPQWKIILKHIVPNCLSPIIVQTTLLIGTTIIAASSLSFLGIGIPAPAPEWGAMLSEGRDYMRSAGYICVIPGLAIMVTVLALNLLGDGLRDALDPKLKK
mgnify:CR=1 FL=1